MADQRGLTFGVQWDIDTAPLDDVEEKQQQLKEDTKEGFWNENAEFLDRFNAYKEAVKCHQFIPKDDKCKLLYSEDLY